jgi:hypothetical protein
MRIPALTATFVVGIVAGFFVSLHFCADRTVYLTIANASPQPLDSVCALGDRFQSRYCVDGQLPPGGASTLPLLGLGKLGYKLSVQFADGRQLEKAFYAEQGSRVQHIISESEIGYKPLPYR